MQNKGLDGLRETIDRLDKILVLTLAERFKATYGVGIYKRDNNLPPIDLDREAAQFKKIAQLAEEAGLQPEFAQKMLRVIIDEVVINHTALQAKKQ